MLQDLHSHTYYSFCGRDDPTELIEKMIESGMEMFGITDHSYGIAKQREYNFFPDTEIRTQDCQSAINQYCDLLKLLKDRYKDKIDLKIGIEVPTIGSMPYIILPAGIDLSKFEYCLIEHIDSEDTVASDVFEYKRSLKVSQAGIAHTDLPNHLKKNGIDALSYFKRMAEENIFWELNVNLDSIHKYKEHTYVEEFFADRQLQETILKSGMKMSIGFDGHRAEEYKPERVKEYCRRLEETGIPFAFA